MKFNNLKHINKTFSNELNRVNNLIKNLLVSKHIDNNIIKSITNNKGKQLRTILLFLCNNKNKISNDIIKTASLIELIHFATLIHDDIIDKAVLRRGEISFFKKWGEINGILYGDYILAIAFKLSHTIKNNKLLNIISNNITDICKGEIIQQKYSYKLNLIETKYIEIIKLKTAALFSLSMESAGILNNYSNSNIKFLKSAGLNFGIAYQIYDDLNDLISSKDDTKKSNFIDLKNGKITLPIIIMLKDCNKDEKKFICKKIFDIKNDKDRYWLFQKLNETKAIQKTKLKADKFIEKACENLAKVNGLKYKDNIKSIFNISFRETSG